MASYSVRPSACRSVAHLRRDFFIEVAQRGEQHIARRDFIARHAVRVGENVPFQRSACRHIIQKFKLRLPLIGVLHQLQKLGAADRHLRGHDVRNLFQPLALRNPHVEFGDAAFLQRLRNLLNVHRLLQLKVARFDAGIQIIILQIALEEIGVFDQFLRLQAIGNRVEAFAALDGEQHRRVIFAGGGDQIARPGIQIDREHQALQVFGRGQLQIAAAAAASQGQRADHRTGHRQESDGGKEENQSSCFAFHN